MLHKNLRAQKESHDENPIDCLLHYLVSAVVWFLVRRGRVQRKAIASDYLSSRVAFDDCPVRHLCLATGWTD